MSAPESAQKRDLRETWPTIGAMQAWPARPVPKLPPDPDAGPLRIFDSARRGPVACGPQSGTARMYVCGITPYDATHLGHAATYLAFDLLQRQWRDLGLDVDYVQNVTDVDDPLLERAEQTGEDWRDLAAREIDLYRADMAALNVLPPDHLIGAVESIGLITELLEAMPTDALYRVDDAEYPDLYLRTEQAEGFGAMARLDDAEALALFGERGGDPDRAGKDRPLDSLVWRLARPGEPSWESPFGAGRPGWHIECAAIARRYLGGDFDVQGGGSDLIFPHHEMSAASARLASGEPLAEAYGHAGMVGLDGEKMSKSRGNLVLVSKLRADGVDPMAVRLALLAHHWRTDWSFDDAQLKEAAARLDRWRTAIERPTGAEAGPALRAMRAALRDDLDAPAALRAVDAWAERTGGDDSAPAAMADAIDALLGVCIGTGRT